MAFDEVDPVGVDNAVVSASDSKVVGDKDDRPFGWCCHTGLSWTPKLLSSSTSSIASTLVASTSTLVASASTSTVLVTVSILIVSIVSALHSNLNNAYK